MISIRCDHDQLSIQADPHYGHLVIAAPKTTLFLAKFPEEIQLQKKITQDNSPQILFLRNFFKAGLYPPLGWLLKRKKTCFNVKADKIDICNAEIRL